MPIPFELAGRAAFLLDVPLVEVSSGSGGPTAAQREVVVLVAQGLSNREIDARRSISVRTVASLAQGPAQLPLRRPRSPVRLIAASPGPA